ncbi:MAG: hypothetical protein NTY48_01395 [Candidatus Diapherotrites archaeon]|nr:hypothetical protein [Candidatus Diapherotrites archaeon]
MVKRGLVKRVGVSKSTIPGLTPAAKLAARKKQAKKMRATLNQILSSGDGSSGGIMRRARTRPRK